MSANPSLGATPALPGLLRLSEALRSFGVSVDRAVGAFAALNAGLRVWQADVECQQEHNDALRQRFGWRRWFVSEWYDSVYWLHQARRRAATLPP